MTQRAKSRCVKPIFYFTDVHHALCIKLLSAVVGHSASPVDQDRMPNVIMSDLQILFVAAEVGAGFSLSMPVQCLVILGLNDFAINIEQQHLKDRLKWQFSLQREKDYPKCW